MRTTDVRDRNYDRVKPDIPNQDALVLEAIQHLGKADAEMVLEYILETYSRTYPITSIRRSIFNLVKRGDLRPDGIRETGYGGTASMYRVISKQFDMEI